MKKLIFSSVILLLCTIFYITGCNKSSGDEIVIGEFESLSGPQATFGQSSTNGLKLAVEEYNNSKDKLLGKTIKLITYDDQGKPSEAQTVVQKLINKDRSLDNNQWFLKALLQSEQS